MSTDKRETPSDNILGFRDHSQASIVMLELFGGRIQHYGKHLRDVGNQRCRIRNYAQARLLNTF
jgi:hypothetical protein